MYGTHNWLGTIPWPKKRLVPVRVECIENLNHFIDVIVHLMDVTEMFQVRVCRRGEVKENLISYWDCLGYYRIRHDHDWNCRCLLPVCCTTEKSLSTHQSINPSGPLLCSDLPSRLRVLFAVWTEARKGQVESLHTGQLASMRQGSYMHAWHDTTAHHAITVLYMSARQHPAWPHWHHEHSLELNKLILSYPMQPHPVQSHQITRHDAGSVCPSVCVYRTSADIDWHGGNVTRQIASRRMF